MKSVKKTFFITDIFLYQLLLYRLFYLVIRFICPLYVNKTQEERGNVIRSWNSEKTREEIENKKNLWK